MQILQISMADVERVRVDNAVKNLAPQIREQLAGSKQVPPILVLVCEEVARLREALARAEKDEDDRRRQVQVACPHCAVCG